METVPHWWTSYRSAKVYSEMGQESRNRRKADRQERKMNIPKNKYDGMGFDEETLTKLIARDEREKLRGKSVSALNRLNENPTSVEYAQLMCDAANKHLASYGSKVTIGLGTSQVVETVKGQSAKR